MFKVPLYELQEKILKSGKLTSVELEKRTKEKINELSGLISEEGATHIIANELGINLFPQGEKLKIKEVYSGMRDVEVVGKVVRKFEVREFAKGERTGKVCSILVGDETGTLRVVFWNDHVNLLQGFQEGDTLQVKHGYVRENNNTKELHLGERSQIVVNPVGETISSVRQSASHERKSIKDLQGGAGAELLGTVIQIFDPRFFLVCPRCNRKAQEQEGKTRCQEHGDVEAALSYVLNCMVDDGTGTIRGVFWKNQIHHLLQKSEQDMVQYRDNPASFENVKTDLLGEQLKLTGTVRKNEMFDRLEFNVQLVEKANPEEELARLEQKA